MSISYEGIGAWCATFAAGTGHSLGGAMAASYAHDNGDKLDGVILLGSYATKKMPENLECLSMLGTLDKIVKQDKFNKNREYFNEILYKEIIIGG